MIRFEDPRQSREMLATLTRHIRVRILNCSAEGCLLEATAPLLLGTVGTLHVSFGGNAVRRSDSGRPLRAHEGHRVLSRWNPFSERDSPVRGNVAILDAVRCRRIGGLAGHAQRVSSPHRDLSRCRTAGATNGRRMLCKSAAQRQEHRPIHGMHRALQALTRSGAQTRRGSPLT